MFENIGTSSSSPVCIERLETLKIPKIDCVIDLSGK